MILPDSKEVFYEFILLTIERDGYINAFMSGVIEQCDKFVAEGF